MAAPEEYFHTHWWRVRRPEVSLKDKVRDRWERRPAARIARGEEVEAGKPVGHIIALPVAILLAWGIVVIWAQRARVSELRLLKELGWEPATQGWRQFNKAAVNIAVILLALLMARLAYRTIVRWASNR